MTHFGKWMDDPTLQEARPMPTAYPFTAPTTDPFPYMEHYGANPPRIALTASPAPRTCSAPDCDRPALREPSPVAVLDAIIAYEGLCERHAMLTIERCIVGEGPGEED